MSGASGSLASKDDSPPALAEAAETFPGEFLEGFALRDSPEFDSWQEREAAILRRELSAVLGRLVESLIQRGEFGDALSHTERWLELDRLQEPAHRALIRLYAWTGEREAALAQYRSCVRVLGQELGVAPLAETTELFEQVSEGTLTGPHRPDATGPAAPATTARGGGVAAGRPHHRARAAASVFIAGCSEQGTLCIVEGEAGIGKSRLCAELLAAVERTGGGVLSARCWEDEAGLPYGPVAELLNEATRSAASWASAATPRQLADASVLQPELAALRSDVLDPMPLSVPGAQVRLMDAVAGIIGLAAGGSTPGVVFVDDLHAADEATLDVLGYMARRLAGQRLMMLLAWRTEAVPPGHRLRRLVAELGGRGGAESVRLRRLEQPEVAELVKAAAPQASPALLERAFAESEGLPLFVNELVAATLSGDGAEPDAGRRQARDLLVERLAAVEDVAGQVLGAAAAIGRSFSFDLAIAAAGRTEDETLGALERLGALGLVRELDGPEPVFDFTHGKLRELVYEGLSPTRRRVLHGRIAAALPDAAETAALAAHHLSLAGRGAEAAGRYRVAAEHAAALLAYADAVGHLEAALGLDPEDAPAFHERIGDLRTLLGDYEQALASYERAAAEAEGWDLAALEQKIGGVHTRRGEWARAETRLDAALDAIPADPSGLRARILADLALVASRSGRLEEAAARGAGSRAEAEGAGDLLAQAQAHNILGILARGEGRLEEARESLTRSVELSGELGDLAAQIAALNNLALVERDDDALDRALELTERALDLCIAFGDRHREAALENNLADLHHAAGDEAEAMNHLKRAVAQFAEVGGDEASRLPEIWKLASW